MATYINEPSHTFNEYLLIPGYSSSECIPDNVSLKQQGGVVVVSRSDYDRIRKLYPELPERDGVVWREGL